MQKDKNLLRTWLKVKRLKIMPLEVSRLSKDINQKLIDLLNWQAFRSVHCYESIESLNEVSTDELMHFLAKQSGMEITLQDKSSQLPMTEKIFDLIVVPTLGFDRSRNRLGWGGGYYDQLLAAQPKALKVGLCFSSCYVPEGLPHEPHDVPLDIIVTEEKIYKHN